MAGKVLHGAAAKAHAAKSGKGAKAPAKAPAKSTSKKASKPYGK